MRHDNWRLWRNIFLLFIVGSWIGHLVEFAGAALRTMVAGPDAWGYIPKTIFWLAEPYGIGAVLLVLFVSPIMKKYGWVMTYIMSVIVTTLSELVCGLIIRWITGSNSVWDYSGRPFNLWGIVWLPNCLLFGACSLVFLYWMFPWLQSLEGKLGQRALNIAFWICLIGFLVYAFWKVGTVLL